MFKDDDHNHLHSERGKMMTEKETRPLQSLRAQDIASETDYDDVASENDNIMALLPQVQRDAEIKTGDSSGDTMISMRAEIDSDW